MVHYIQANDPNSVNKMMILRPCIWQGRFKSKHIEHSSPRTIPHLFLEQHEQIAYIINHKSPSEAACMKNIGIVNSHELALTLRNIQLLVLSFQTSSSSKLQIPFAKPAAYEMLMFMLLRQDRNNARIIQKSIIQPKEGRTNLFLEICVISYVTELFYLGCANLLIFAGNIIIFLLIFLLRTQNKGISHIRITHQG